MDWSYQTTLILLIRTETTKTNDIQQLNTIRYLFGLEEMPDLGIWIKHPSTPKDNSDSLVSIFCELEDAIQIFLISSHVPFHVIPLHNNL